MKNVKEFVEQLVKIELMDGEECYGHYPFLLFVETSDGKFEMNALALGGDVESCYNRAKKYFNEGAKKVFMSLDFPESIDINNDFVCIYSIVDGEFDVYAIPYNFETGEIYDEIHESEILDKILEDFKSICLK